MDSLVLKALVGHKVKEVILDPEEILERQEHQVNVSCMMTDNMGCLLGI